MELTNEQIAQLKQTELEILKVFIQVCEKLKIRYFVVQGTLLGAVRHQGFIPWDDDIDVGMLREDYQIFLEKGQALLPEKYFIQTHRTDRAYPHGFAKIRNRHTAFVETTCKNLPMNHGIYIDVFPFDYYPDTWWEREWLEIKKFLLRYRIRSILFIPSDHGRTAASLLRKIIKKISQKLYPSVHQALDEQYELYFYSKRSRLRANYGSPWGKRERIPSKWVEEQTVLTFEGLKVYAPLYYREYLTKVYGSYMELPPPEKRIPHHYVSYINFEKAY